MTVTPPLPPLPPASGPQPVRVDDPAIRSVWVLAGVAVVAIIGWIVNMVAGFGFPSGAPLEWVSNAGISLALIAVAIATGVGALISIRPRPVRPARVLPWLAAGFGVAALIAWAVTASGLFETLSGGRGRYIEDVAGAALFGVPWSLAAIFGAYGYRIPARPRHNAAAIAGIVLWAVVLVGVLLSAVLYAADLTD